MRYRYPQVTGSRRCCRCGEVKDLTEFYRRPLKDGAVGYRSNCKACTRLRLDAIERTAHDEHDRHTRTHWDITRVEYDEILSAQGGGCAVCGVQRSQDGRRLAVDHDHATGLIRGVLCVVCNRILGALEDRGVERFLGYLGQPPAVQTIGERYAPSKAQAPTQLTLQQLAPAPLGMAGRATTHEEKSHEQRHAV